MIETTMRFARDFGVFGWPKQVEFLVGESPVGRIQFPLDEAVRGDVIWWECVAVAASRDIRPTQVEVRFIYQGEEPEPI